MFFLPHSGADTWWLFHSLLGRILIVLPVIQRKHLLPSLEMIYSEKRQEAKWFIAYWSMKTHFSLQWLLCLCYKPLCWSCLSYEQATVSICASLPYSLFFSLLNTDIGLRFCELKKVDNLFPQCLLSDFCGGWFHQHSHHHSLSSNMYFLNLIYFLCQGAVVWGGGE